MKDKMIEQAKLSLKKFSLIVVFVNCLLSVVNDSFGQVDYNRQYTSAKSLFSDKKYNLAMEGFKPLISYDQKNPYSEYASFYYAVAAYHQGYLAVAKDMFNQIRKLYPTWDKLPEVNFWLGKIHFANRDYFQGLKTFESIQDKKYEKDIETVKINSIASIADVETLKMMHEEYSKDPIIAKYLAINLSKSVSDPEDKKQLEELIEKFKLKRTDFIPEAPKTVHKEKYAVSLLLPFMMSTLEPTPGRKRNQIVLDFYEGAKLAVDTLAKQKINISLRAYDTERSLERLKRILDTEELKHTDLILGPLFPEENKMVQDFSVSRKINVFHPFSNNTELIGLNPHAFLFQPSAEVIGKKSADYMADHARGKKTMVFYGPGKKDSVLAANYAQEATQKGMRLLSSVKINNKETKKISDILSTPTEFDEFKYPSQFTLKKDSVHSIFVASDDPLIYTKIVGAVEMRGDSVLVLGSESWLDDNAIDLEKYQTLRIALSAPNHWDVKKAQYKAFDKKFLRAHGRVASNVARMGYELMMFVGHQLKMNGVYFQEGLAQAGVLPGYLGEGFDYRFSRDNQVIPFTTFKRGELTLIEKR
jgi:tetratricopeptide (TPR) repeat protein